MTPTLKPTFEDIHGNTWTTKVTVATQARVRLETTHNLLALAEPDSELLRLCASDDVLLFRVLCAVLRPQITQRFGEGEQADMQFAESLDETSSRKAILALMDGLFLFFGDRKRALLKGAHDKIVSAHDRLTDKALTKAEELLLDPKLDAKLDEVLQTALSEKFGNPPDSSPSTSAP